MADALVRADRTVREIVATPDPERTFDNTVGRLDDMIAQLELDTNMTLFLAYVSTDSEEREVGQQAEEDVQNWLIDLHKREDLYRAVKAYTGTNPSVDADQKRLLEHTMRDYRRAGMDLPPDRREDFSPPWTRRSAR